MIKLNYSEKFNVIVDKAKSFATPRRVVIARADNENILQGVFAAQEAGFAKPILLGSEKKIKDMLDKLGLADKPYELHPLGTDVNSVQYAIEMIRAGSADVLMRGNTQPRDLLMPILNRANHLVMEDHLVTHVSILSLPNYDRLLAVSDCTLLIEPSLEQREEGIKNMVTALNAFGIQHPNIALLSLVEKPSFHMRDTVEAQTIVMHHKEEALADCNLVGPITYDLILSKEAARLKHYECEYCGEFDGIVVPELLAGNLICKFAHTHFNSAGCGILVGAKIPVAISGRSESVEQAFLSLAGSIALHS